MLEHRRPAHLPRQIQVLGQACEGIVTVAQGLPDVGRDLLDPFGTGKLTAHPAAHRQGVDQIARQFGLLALQAPAARGAEHEIVLPGQHAEKLLKQREPVNVGRHAQTLGDRTQALAIVRAKMERQLSALEALGAAMGEVGGQFQRRCIGQLRLPPGQLLGLDRLTADMKGAAPVAVGLGIDLGKRFAIDQGEQLGEQHIEGGQVGGDMVDAQQHRVLDTLTQLVAHQHQPADLTGSEVEGLVGQFDHAALHADRIRALPGFALQRAGLRAAVPLQQLAITLDIGTAQVRVTLLHHLPGPVQTLRQIGPEVLRPDSPGQGDVVGATVRLHTLQEPQRLLVIVERACLEVIRVALQPGQNLGSARLQFLLQLGTQGLRQGSGNHQAAFAGGQADTAQPAVMHQAIEHVSSFIVRIRGQPPWGTSKNYLRCHRCVKNRLKMLIYSS